MLRCRSSACSQRPSSQGINAAFHLTAVFTGAYMMYAVFQQRSFGRHSRIELTTSSTQ
jgi:hypothetical protein